MWRLFRRLYRQPEDLERSAYLQRLRWSDYRLLRALEDNGACSAQELWLAVWPRAADLGDSKRPTLRTIEDWLTLAHRRGLITRFSEDPDNVQRWTPTERGRDHLRRPDSALRIASVLFASLVKFSAWSIPLVLGSATILALDKGLDVNEIVNSDAFSVVVLLLLLGLGVLGALALFGRARRDIALALIEMTRRYGQVDDLESVSVRPPTDSTEEPTPWSRQLAVAGVAACIGFFVGRSWRESWR